MSINEISNGFKQPFLILVGSLPAGVLRRVVVSVAVEKKGEDHINKS